MNRKEREMTTPLQKAIEGLTTAKIQFSNADDASYVWVSKSQVLEIIRQHESQQVVNDLRVFYREEDGEIKIAKARFNDFSRDNEALFVDVTDRVAAYLRTEQPRVDDEQLKLEWRDGYPPHPWDKEWFIAMTTFGDRVVLKALPKEYTYDFKTADDTFIMKDKIKKWMQFPDSEYIAPAALSADKEPWEG